MLRESITSPYKETCPAHWSSWVITTATHSESVVATGMFFDSVRAMATLSVREQAVGVPTMKGRETVTLGDSAQAEATQYVVDKVPAMRGAKARGMAMRATRVWGMEMLGEMEKETVMLCGRATAMV
ncbi:MAG: hypothetical protein OXI12_15100 [Gammaproteobacteria bacterium]|nr:hypothetical protein [Gammaproteobacteria bacterium]